MSWPIIGFALGFLIAAVLWVGHAMRFDGSLAEPGCDWGSKNCQRDDYRAMCRTYDGAVTDARWVQWCEGRHW